MKVKKVKLTWFDRLSMGIMEWIGFEPYFVRTSGSSANYSFIHYHGPFYGQPRMDEFNKSENNIMNVKAEIVSYQEMMLDNR